MVTLANSGTEAVEAAVKHAELEAVRRLQATQQQGDRNLQEFRLRSRRDPATGLDGCWDRIARRFDLPQQGDWSTLADLIARHNRSAFSEPPTFLALEGGFHGKTTGSLSLTHNPEHRQWWGRLACRVAFLPPGDEDALQHAIDETRTEYLAVELQDDGGLDVVRRSVCNVAAAFVEPIQGEGGIREVPRDYIQLLRQTADREGFPVVIDEIQSGMGRTGTLLASEISGVGGDYYLLSKSLGGGLAKLSALLVDRRRYQEDFGYLHTSTFAEDDFSCEVPLAVLNIIRRDDFALLTQCRDKGRHLIDRLNALRERYPDQVRGVRGRGLMVGLELADQQEASSPLLRVLSEQGLLGYMACGWLLHHCRIRVAPTLSAPNVLRVEPSAYVSSEDLDRFCRGLDELLATIQGEKCLELMQFLSARRAEIERPRLGIVGGAGNIGSVLTDVAADEIDRIVLIGRKGARRRLGELADRLYQQAWQKLQHSRTDHGLADALARTTAAEQFSGQRAGDEDGLGTRLRAAVEEELGDQSPVQIAEDLDALKECNLIISATNAPRPIIGARHLGASPAVICDVAAPGDLDPTVTESRPDITALKGGIIKLPRNQTLDIPGMPMPPGELYACLAETLLLGLEAVDDHFSYGPLSADRVRFISQIAHKHGFEIQDKPV